MQGRNGRLFLANDSNHVLDQHSGALAFSQALLQRWRLTLENRVAWLDRHGIPYLFLIAPNAHSVYPEDLPEGIESADRRPVHQLMQELKQHESFASVVYPLDALVSVKATDIIFSKTDTHWTARAGYIAYRELVRRIPPEVPVSPVSEEHIEFYEVERVGDLGYKTDPTQSAVDVEASVLQPRAWLVSDNRVQNIGSMISTICPRAAASTCLLFGDSYWYGVGRYLASSHRHFVFAHTTRLDHEIVAEVRPNLVVSVINERFLIQVPDDVGGESLKRMAAKKEADGALRPQAQVWTPIEERTRAG